MDDSARKAALQRLEPFIGSWEMEAIFPADPSVVMGGGRCVFEWMQGGQLLIQRIEIPAPEAPDSIGVIAANAGNDSYTQHYFDSRGVVRLYAMTYVDGIWKLLRDSPDFSPLDFSQRFTGTFSDDGDVIRGEWETSSDGSTWKHDFDLVYRRMK